MVQKCSVKSGKKDERLSMRRPGLAFCEILQIKNGSRIGGGGNTNKMH